MSYSVSNVMAEAGIANILRWVPFAVDEVELRNRIKNKMIRPTTIPQTLEDLVIEQAICREALRLSFEQHKALAVGLKGKQTARDILDVLDQSRRGTLVDLLDLGLLVGSGGVLSHAPRRAQAMLMMIDAFLPEGITELAVDSIFMTPQLGVLSTVHETAATQVFERDCLVIWARAWRRSGRRSRAAVRHRGVARRTPGEPVRHAWRSASCCGCPTRPASGRRSSPRRPSAASTSARARAGRSRARCARASSGWSWTRAGAGRSRSPTTRRAHRAAARRGTARSTSTRGRCDVGTRTRRAARRAETLVRRERRLPLKGQVCVAAGAEVGPETVIARCELPGNVQTVNLAAKLGVDPRGRRDAAQARSARSSHATS
jgi:hypothetical protein